MHLVSNTNTPVSVLKLISKTHFTPCSYTLAVDSIPPLFGQTDVVPPVTDVTLEYARAAYS